MARASAAAGVVRGTVRGALPLQRCVDGLRGGAALGGGFAPLIAAALQTRTGTSMSVSLYMVVVGMVSVGAVLALREPRPLAVGWA